MKIRMRIESCYLISTTNRAVINARNLRLTRTYARSQLKSDTKR